MGITGFCTGSGGMRDGPSSGPDIACETCAKTSSNAGVGTPARHRTSKKAAVRMDQQLARAAPIQASGCSRCKSGPLTAGKDRHHGPLPQMARVRSS